MLKLTLTHDSVRQACIHNDWYTNGTCADYENMLGYVREHCSDMADFEARAKIEYIADDIYKHSNVRLMADMAGCAPIEVRANMEFVLLNSCTMSF